MTQTYATPLYPLFLLCVGKNLPMRRNVILHAPSDEDITCWPLLPVIVAPVILETDEDVSITHMETDVIVNNTQRHMHNTKQNGAVETVKCSRGNKPFNLYLKQVKQTASHNRKQVENIENKYCGLHLSHYSNHLGNRQPCSVFENDSQDRHRRCSNEHHCLRMF